MLSDGGGKATAARVPVAHGLGLEGFQRRGVAGNGEVPR